MSEETQWVAVKYYGEKPRSIMTEWEESIRPNRRGTILPATPSEIADEIEKRGQRADSIRIEREFRARPDYKDADAIKDILEWMEPFHNVLDRLTPAEWSALRQKLS